MVRLVAEDEWGVVVWLWQAFRRDLANVVQGLPYADGRYQWQDLRQFPSPDGTGYLAWRPHPNTGQDAPIGFALVDGLQGPRRSLAGLWVVTAARGDGIGRTLVLDVLGRHRGPWAIGFQHENPAAGRFWRRVADAAFGPAGWSADERAVPGRPQVPPDHWIETL